MSRRARMRSMTLHLIVVHGPPGIGKDTIAGRLATRLGYRYLNYHRMMEEFGAVFGWATPPYLHVRDRAVGAVQEAILETDWPGLVWTMIFEPTIDIDGWNELFARVHRSLVVDLRASAEEHAGRLASAGRPAAGKGAKAADIAPLVADGTFDVPAVTAPVFVLDTTNLSADEAVDAIARRIDREA
jgi:broad-specificity NMP kinase